MTNKKILYLAVYYAPMNVVPTFRNLKLSKYLSRNCFKQYIFTMDIDINVNLELNKEIPKDAVVYRKKIRLPEVKFLSALNVRENLFSKIKYMIKDLFFSPDRFIWWVISYLPAMIKVIRKEQIELIYVGGRPPSSSFIGGYFLKKICKTKLILDFHDPWKTAPINLQQSCVRRFFDSFWEKLCVKNADLITVCTDSVMLELKQNYNLKANIVKIANGYDPEDFYATNKIKPVESEYLFLYAGKYSIKDNEYNPSMIISAFMTFLEKHKATDCTLFLVGLTDDETMRFIDNQKTQNIKCKGLVSKQEVVLLQSQADCFIHFHYPNAITDRMSLKICEYAISNKPILSFNEKKGEAFDFIQSNMFGETVNNNELDEMVDLFFRAYNNEIKICDNPKERLKDFEWGNIAITLSENLSKLTESM